MAQPRENTNPPELSSWMTEGRIVTIQVGTGPTKKRFPVHEKLITHNSPFFDQYFNHSMEPGEEAPEMLRLPDIDVHIFTIFMNWVYATSWTHQGPQNHSTRAARNFRFPLPDTPEAQGMSQFSTREQINMEDVKYIFDCTPNDSPMRRYLVCQLLFFFFDRERAGKPLPQEWATVLGEQGSDIGFSMFRMLNDWAWGFENQVPRMVVKSRNYFYDEVVTVKVEKIEDDDEQEKPKEGNNGGGNGGAGGGNGLQRQQLPAGGYGATQARRAGSIPMAHVLD
ncbi:hypothetical protein QBC43DRAFT_352366 [Cladorrhinum sp. PSN259]|nr:hypothetical protein QBC43DRAFT_352366 [Cladorrhinum sp. PSN259]